MKEFFNKIKSFFKKEKIKKATDWCIKNRRFFFAAFLFIALVVVLYACTGSNAKKDTKDNASDGGQASTENGAADFTLDSDFEKDAHADVNELITSYFASYASADIDALEAIASPISDNEKSYIQVFSAYIESYENISCYTKSGLTDNSYLVSAYFDLKFYGVETMAPGLDFFYVETKDDGSLYINNLYSPYNLSRTENTLDPNVYAVILQFGQQADVIALRDQVKNAYSEAVASDVDLATMLSTTIPNAMTEWMENVITPADTGDEDTQEPATDDGSDTTADNADAVDDGSDTTADNTDAVDDGSDVPADNTDAADNGGDTPVDNGDTPADDAVVDDTPVDNTPDETPAVDENREVKVKVNIKSVKVREKASTSSDVIAGAEKGDTFTKLGEKDGWTEIDYNGKTGYIKSDYVDEVTE